MNRDLNILHLEDDRLDAELVQATLVAQGIVTNIVLVQTEEEFRTLLQAKNIDLILADYTLPGFNGTAALRLAREARPELPFIFVSGTVGEEFAIETLKGGATDYVLKQGLQRLGLSVRRALNEVQERRRLLDENQQLRECEERQRLFFDRCPAALWVYDLGTLEFLAINEAAIEQYGYSREEFLELSLRDICRPEDFPPLPELGNRPATDSRSSKRFCKHRKKDGATFDVEVTSQTINFNGRPAEIDLARVITGHTADSRQSGGNILSTSPQKEERTGIVHELWQASKRATISELAGRIASELSQPLAIMSTVTECMAAGLCDAESHRREVDEMSEQLNRIGSLTSNLLHLSKLNQQQVSRVDLREVLLNSLEFMDDSLRLHKIEVVSEFAAQSSDVNVDPHQIRQVFFNLLSNAIESMSHGGVLRARVYPGVLDSGQSSVVAELVDTGTGFNNEQLLKLSAPSFLAENWEQSELGLAISRRTIMEYGGKLEIMSSPGQGTTVRVLLPAAVDRARTRTTQPAVASG